ncbi:hypothetical protein DEJ31_15995 [Curtobacterium sp. MCPF17_031]|nr:hypothetical protein DEJ31_15995 [Curtobacterium sp. MCPF17_031]
MGLDMASRQERQLRQRQLDALRGIATVPLGKFPTTQPVQAPNPAEVADRMRQIVVADPGDDGVGLRSVAEI